SQDSPRHVEVIYADEIQSNPVHSVSDVLRYISSVDVMQRGVFGIQSDVGIRGGGFEHTLILLNGMRINDPQTGHHNLNIPLSLTDIERIEIIPAGTGLYYSAGSFGGVINIVTRSESDKTFGGIFSIGSDGYINGLASLSLKKDDIRFNLSAHSQKGNGYRLNTDFETKSFQMNMDTKVLSLFAGYTDKRFGANGFYTLRYPLQWENTKTTVLSGRLKTKISDVVFEPSILYRHGYDYYILDRSNPDFYKNTHRTNVINTLLPFQYGYKNKTINFGMDMSFDSIDSTRLGKHHRDYQAIFVGITDKTDKIIASIDARIDRFSQLDRLEFSPSMAIAYKLSDDVKFRAAFNRSFRLPSYTELYYTSPVHRSNPNLKPETAYNLEAGMDFSKDYISSKFTIFKRWGTDIIDWVKAGDMWVSENIDKLDTIGLTLGTQLYINPKNILKIDYTWLDQDNEINRQTTYGNYLRHKVSLILSSKLSKAINNNIAVTHQKRLNQSSFTLVDFKTIKHVKLDNLDINMFLEGKNVFNKGYYDFVGLPMPGRTLFLGLTISI
ncbi:MAG: TonB-dependent receptor, partial [Thermodesulfovibrionales bacterium]